MPCVVDLSLSSSTLKHPHDLDFSLTTSYFNISLIFPQSHLHLIYTLPLLLNSSTTSSLLYFFIFLLLSTAIPTVYYNQRPLLRPRVLLSAPFRTPPPVLAVIYSVC